MKAHTSQFKENIKDFGRELDSKITYTINGITTELGNEQLNSVSPHYEGAILKSVMKQLDIDSNVEIPVGTILNYQLGVKTGNDKNYFDISKVKNRTGYITNNGDSITITSSPTTAQTGNSPNKLSDYCPNCEVGETYTLFAKTTGVYKWMWLREADEYWRFGTSKTLTQEMLNSQVYWSIGGTSNTATISNIKVEEGTGAYEYITLGTFVVYKVEKQEDTQSYKITCYDKMLYSMKDYESLNITYPITVRNYINAICNKLGLTFKNINDTFANYDKQIPKELYLDTDGKSLDYTFRDVLDDLAEVTASTICINEDDGKLEIRYINNTNDTIDEEFLKDVNVNFGDKYGAINTIVLSRSAGADNIYYPSTLPQNPIEIKISDNQIMNGNDRDTYMPDIYNKLNGLQYYINDFSSTGICYYDLCDKYNVQIGENIYTCIMFNDEINITQGLEEFVHTDMPNEAVTDYTKADSTDRKINQTTLIVDKQQHEITALVDTTQDIQKEINPTKDANGTSFYLEDSTDAELVSFELEGKTTQATSTQSANLFDEEYYKNATYATNVYKYTLTRIKGTGTTLYTKASLKSGKTNISGLYMCLSSTPNPISSGSKFSMFVKNGNLYNGNFIPDNNSDLYFSFYPTSVNVSDIFDTYNIWVSTTDTSYTPFIPNSPSPDYPSELVSVGYKNYFTLDYITATGITKNELEKNDFTYTNCWASDIVLNANIVKMLKPSTTYTIKYKYQVLERPSSFGQHNTSYNLGLYNGSQMIWFGRTNKNSIDLNTWETITTEFTTPASLTNYRILAYNFKDTNNTTTGIIRISELIITEKENDFIPFGKYGIEVKNIGKNLIPFTTQDFTLNSVHYYINNGSLYFNGTSTGETSSLNDNFKSNFNFTLPSGTYTISHKTGIMACYLYKYDNNTSILTLGTDTTSQTFTLSETTKVFISFYVYQKTFDNVNSEIMISKSGGTYEPYEGKTYLYTLNEPLRSIGDTKDLLYIKNGYLYVERKIGSVVLDENTVLNYNGSAGKFYAPNQTIVPNYLSSSTMLSNYLKYSSTTWVANCFGITSANAFWLYIENGPTSLPSLQTWLSTHNTEVDYILANSYIEELGQVNYPTTYKPITYIETTDELQPNMAITYVMDTQITNYVENQVSQIKITENSIVAEVNKKVDNDEIIAKLNLAIEDEQGIIEITGNQVIIDSDYFELNADGTIKSTGGTIGGYKIDDSKLYAETFAKYTYNSSDLEKIRNYLMGTGTLTPEEFIKYDVDESGTITSYDFLMVKFFIDYNVTPTSSAKIIMQTGNSISDNAYVLQDGGGNDIVKLNFNGIYYRDANIGNAITYSQNEIEIGKWIDDKPIYRKVIDFGSLPTASATKSVAHGISNIDTITKIETIAKDGTTYFPIPFSAVPSMYSNTNCSIRVDNTNVSVNVTSDWSNKTAIVILEYTKTTD